MSFCFSRIMNMTLYSYLLVKRYESGLQYVTLFQTNPGKADRLQDYPGIYTCTLDDGLDTIFETIRKSRVHRLVVVDDNNALAGVLSLSDILAYILLEGEQDPIIR